MRIGLLGGTFDPIHLGHLLLAEQARDALWLDRVLLIPAARPPHKPERVLTPWSDRMRMVELAVEEIDGFEASDLEREDGHPNFTVETLRRLRSSHPADDEFWLLLGGDSLEEITSWREPEAIVELARLAVYPRPGWSAGIDPAAAALRVPPVADWERNGRIRWIPGPPLRLSSSEIRDRAAQGRSLRFLVPEGARLYLLERGLYRERAEGDHRGG